MVRLSLRKITSLRFRYAATGNAFAGRFERDKKNGQGVYVWQSGSRYEGFFVDNNIHGKGVLDLANGSSYKARMHARMTAFKKSI